LKAVRIALTSLILAVLITPSVYNQAPRQGADSGGPTGVERTVPMGDYRFHYIDQGTGAPTVVMEAGLCQPISTWGDVAAEVAAFTRVFVYDRAGVGGSSGISPQGVDQSARPQGPRTSHRIVKELRDLLRKAGAPAPYVLVGHSFGGLNVRLYASERPDEVAGIVLIDSSNEEEYIRYASLMPPGKKTKYTRVNRGSNCEFVNLDLSAAELREAAPLPPVPLTVITPVPKSANLETSQAHLDLQVDLVSRSAKSVHLFAERSGHFIQRDRPDIVIKAIRDVVDRARAPFIPFPTEDDLKQARILHLSFPSEAAISGAALALSGLVGWRWRKRKRKAEAELNRAQRRQASRKMKKGNGE